MRKIILLCSILTFQISSFSQSGSCFLAGVRLQKTHNLYYENGLTFDYTNPKFLNNKLHVGFSYVTSRLGSAIASNAIKQDNYLVSFAYHFRHEKIVCPIIQLDAGQFYADMEYEIFDEIPHKSFILATETGLFLNFNSPIKAKATIGYHLLTGNGESGPGTLFPLFFQFSLYYMLNL